jgi:two-component system response regulator
MNRVLLIEDNDDDIELAKRTFEKAGCSGIVRVARDGVEALDLLLGRGAYEKEGPSTTIRLILLDLNLPKLNGLDLLRQIRLNPGTQKIPVVVLTVSKREPDLLLSFTMGISDYVIKPLDPDRFAQIFRKYVQETPA